ncbi:hypothetical protein GCM10022416_32020 [Actinomadura keratinilytica]|uniref:Uncharacterized protein n=1 Tax=Actinomadura keratinilytica TaxID=547461 RepID=A0ABP7YWW8_9ACTN
MAGATRSGAFSTFDTVWRETPAAAATSEMVTPLRSRMSPVTPIGSSGTGRFDRSNRRVSDQIGTVSGMCQEGDGSVSAQGRAGGADARLRAAVQSRRS